MTRAHARYVRVEAIVGALFGAVFGLGFCYLFFGAAAQVPVHERGLILDAVPQSFMTALFAALFPTFLTRKRLRLGLVAGAPGGSRGLPRSGILRVLLLAVMTAVLGVALWAVALARGPAYLPFLPVLAVKTAYGALIGGAVAATAAHAALGDRQP